MGKKDNNVGNATGYNEKGKRKTRAKKKDQTVFQLGQNVGLWACAKKQKLKYLNCIQLAGKYALSVQGFSCQLAKDWYRGEELFILVLTSVNEFEDCDNHHITGMPIGKEKKS